MASSNMGRTLAIYGVVECLAYSEYAEKDEITNRINTVKVKKIRIVFRDDDFCAVFEGTVVAKKYDAGETGVSFDKFDGLWGKAVVVIANCSAGFENQIIRVVLYSDIQDTLVMAEKDR